MYKLLVAAVCATTTSALRAETTTDQSLTGGLAAYRAKHSYLRKPNGQSSSPVRSSYSPSRATSTSRRSRSRRSSRTSRRSRRDYERLPSVQEDDTETDLALDIMEGDRLKREAAAAKKNAEADQRAEQARQEQVRLAEEARLEEARLAEVARLEEEARLKQEQLAEIARLE